MPFAPSGLDQYGAEIDRRGHDNARRHAARGPQGNPPFVLAGDFFQPRYLAQGPEHFLRGNLRHEHHDEIPHHL